MSRLTQFEKTIRLCKNDECYTPRWVVELVLEKYQIKKDWIIWCPFDKAESEFVKVLKEKGFNVVYSHIDNGQDFYQYEPNKWDCIISNPPFTNKRLIAERCLSFNKPFILLQGCAMFGQSGYAKTINKFDKIYFIEKYVEFNKLGGGQLNSFVVL